MESDQVSVKDESGPPTCKLPELPRKRFWLLIGAAFFAGMILVGLPNSDSQPSLVARILGTGLCLCLLGGWVDWMCWQDTLPAADRIRYFWTWFMPLVLTATGAVEFMGAGTLIRHPVDTTHGLKGILAIAVSTPLLGFLVDHYRWHMKFLLR